MTYDALDKALCPIWAGEIIHNESVMFVPCPDGGTILPGNLLFAPDDVLSVRSSDLLTTYKTEQDYLIDGNRLIRLPEGQIPCFDLDEYYLPKPSSIPIESVSFPGRYVRYEPGGIEYLRRQVMVTYRHHGTWQGEKPVSQLPCLARTAERLLKRQPLHILFYGDSVMEGCDASGRSGIAPYLPPIDQLVTLGLAKHYGHGGIRRTNTAVGGTDSRWGLANAKERLSSHNPDLIVLRFGGNDGSRCISAQEFIGNIKNIIRTVRDIRPLAEFLLMPTDMPNPDCKGWTLTHADYEPALADLAQCLPSCGFIPFTSIWRYLEGIKGYAGLCGNGVNHPNDFMVRVYAQSILACLT